MKKSRIVSRPLGTTLSALMIASLAACGGGGGASSSTDTAQSASMSVLVSDASSDDWATIGVKVLSISLTPQGGGAAVTVYTAPTPAPMINLAQLDQLGEILGNVSIPVGSYTGATLTVSANPGDVALTTSADPETGFAAAASTAIPSGQIQIQGAQGATGSKTVSVPVSFDSPLVVSATQSNALNLEVDLAHPAFIVGHAPLGGGTIWSVNFKGPVKHRRVEDITRQVLRHTYGTVTAVASDNASITITKDLPTLPVQTPETAVQTGQSLGIRVDAANGTLFYDLDAKTSFTIKDFSTVASGLSGKYVRIAARYQQDGSLVATRIWTSSSFNTVWLSPEGHVLHVRAGSNSFAVADESGRPVTIAVDANTKFFFRTPANALSDATPIGTGPSFLAANNLVRGFKVHVQVADPLAAQLVATSVDIETAAYGGRISNATTSGFSYTRNFFTSTDDYTVALSYISSSTPNGKDASGNAITGFKYWDFAYPTLLTSGAGAVTSFVSAATGSVNFGGTVGAVKAHGASYAAWGNASNPTGWSAPWVVLVPTPLPMGRVSSGLSNGAFAMTVTGGASAATVDVSTTPGSATLVYQVDRSNGVVTVSPEDITGSAGLAALTAGLATGAPVRVYGVPKADGTLKAYAVTYFTGMTPAP